VSETWTWWTLTVDGKTAYLDHFPTDEDLEKLGWNLDPEPEDVATYRVEWEE